MLFSFHALAGKLTETCFRIVSVAVFLIGNVSLKSRRLRYKRFCIKWEDNSFCVRTIPAYYAHIRDAGV